MIRFIRSEDAEGICNIYNYYVINTTITFEEKEVSEEEMRRRIDTTAKAYPWYVFEENYQILGYAYATKWKERSAYRFSTESTIYVRNGHTGKGIGAKLYEALLSSLEKQGIHVVLGGIAQPNEASVRLHERLGFSKVGQLSEVGYKLGKWIDVGYWELKLPRKIWNCRDMMGRK